MPGNAILLPGIEPRGSLKYFASVSSSQTSPDSFIAAEYWNPSRLPALRPMTPCRLGPTGLRTFASIAWQILQRANSTLPCSASAAPLAGWAIRSSRASKAAVRIMHIPHLAGRMMRQQGHGGERLRTRCSLSALVPAGVAVAVAPRLGRLAADQFVEIAALSAGGPLLVNTRQVRLVKLFEELVPGDFLQCLVIRVGRIWEFDPDDTGAALSVRRAHDRRPTAARLRPFAD